MKSTICPAWQSAIITLSAVVTTGVILAILYIGRVVLIPIAMAIFFTYVLSPVVNFLQRLGITRVLAVLITVGMAVALFLATSFMIAQQLSGLTDTVAEHSETIKLKVERFRSSLLGSPDSPLNRLIDDLERMLQSDQPKSDLTVVLEPKESAWTSSVNTLLGPVTEAFGQAAISFILSIFMLLSKTDLADRVLRIMGENQMTVMTRAMNDASVRVSRYLFKQFVVNFGFGMLVAGILFLLGLQYAILWGFLIFLMRYVPYIGIWLGVLPPAIFAFATSSDSYLAPIVIGVIVGMELILNNALEPLIYGRSHGVSEVAQLISAAVWSFLWGPIGLILSNPITTCLLVLGRHAPPFRFLEILLGKQPALSPDLSLFQRLAAKDHDEAMRTLQKALKNSDPDTVFDEVILPALKNLKTSRIAGHLDAADDAQISAMTREIIEDTLDDIREPVRKNEEFVERIRVLACPAQDEFDWLALHGLQNRLPAAYWNLKVTSPTTLTAELVSEAIAFEPQVIVIASLPPEGVAHARYLVKRMRQRFPNAHLLLCRWADPTLTEEDWKAVGCDASTSSFRAALKHLNSRKPILQAANESSEREMVEQS